MPAFIHISSPLAIHHDPSSQGFRVLQTKGVHFTTFLGRVDAVHAQPKPSHPPQISIRAVANEFGSDVAPLDLNSPDLSDVADPNAMGPPEEFFALFDTLESKFSTPMVDHQSFQMNDRSSRDASPRTQFIDNSLDDDMIRDILLDDLDGPSVPNENPKQSNIRTTSDSGRSEGKRAKPFRKKSRNSEKGDDPFQTSVHDDSDEDVVLSLLSQSYAVSAETLPPIEDISSSQSVVSNDDFLDPLESPDITARNLRFQSQPCVQSTSDLEQILSRVKKRRSFLSAESAENSVPPLEAHPFLPVESQSLSSTSNSDGLKTFIDDFRETTSHNFFTDSVRNSLPLDLRQIPTDRENAILSCSAKIVETVCKTPYVYRPFLALHAAVMRLNKPLCPRCQAPTEQKTLNLQSVCESCYSVIYSENSISSAVCDPFLSYSRTALEDARLVQQAASVVRGSVSDGSSKTSAGPKKTSAGTSGNSVDGTTNGVGHGGSIPSENYHPPSVGDGWRVAASDRSLRTINPIRNLVQNIRVKPNPAKSQIKLSVGDPTVYGNLAISTSIVDALCETLRSGRANGYSLSMGDFTARTAIAQRYSSSASHLSADDVFITSGASGALELALGALANEGDNVLLPSPGFPLFRTLAENFGIECRFYSLDSEQDWQIKLADIGRLVDERTRAILVNNPSNPCGSVFSQAHIKDILAVAEALRIPLIADEVYSDMVFTGEFKSFGELSMEVPTLVVGGISKQFVVPGWRIGWVLVHDRGGVFEKAGVRRGLRQLTTRMICGNTPVQMVIPEMLKDQNGFRKVMSELRSNAEFTAKRLTEVRGLKCVEAKGAMYVMVGIDVEAMHLKDDMEFTELLYEEEAVFVLPGQCFQAPNFVRVVFAAPREVLADAFERIEAFCERRLEGSSVL